MHPRPSSRRSEMPRAVSIGADGGATLMRISTCNNAFGAPALLRPDQPEGIPMNQIIYIVGAIVIVMALLSFVGLN